MPQKLPEGREYQWCQRKRRTGKIRIPTYGRAAEIYAHLHLPVITYKYYLCEMPGSPGIEVLEKRIPTAMRTTVSTTGLQRFSI